MRSLETRLGPAPVTCHVSSCQGIPWTKVDYFDNGIICNLIEHVSYLSVISETSSSRLPEYPCPVPPLAPLGKDGEMGKR